MTIVPTGGRGGRYEKEGTSQEVGVKIGRDAPTGQGMPRTASNQQKQVWKVWKRVSLQKKTTPTTP